jgi:hypothetical protein
MNILPAKNPAFFIEITDPKDLVVKRLQTRYECQDKAIAVAERFLKKGRLRKRKVFGVRVVNDKGTPVWSNNTKSLNG